MKKTISALALSASSASFALMMPPTQTKTICLNAFESSTGTLQAGTCDQAANNAIRNLVILDNGCAAEQIALVTAVYNGTPVVSIRSCLPPNVAQL